MGGGSKLIAACIKAGRPIHPDDEPPALHWEDRIWWLYLRVRTQWRHRGFAGEVCGLDYAPAVAICHALGWNIALALEMLQVIEMEMLAPSNS